MIDKLLKIIDDNFYQMIIVLIIFAGCIVLFLMIDKTEKKCEKNKKNWMCKPITEVFK